MMPQALPPNADESEPINRSLGSFITQVAKSVRPLYAVEERKLAAPLGSGVLISVGSARFVLTAAHVFRERVSGGVRLSAVFPSADPGKDRRASDHRTRLQLPLHGCPCVGQVGTIDAGADAALEMRA
jgi:hypothetical protein